MGHFSWSEEISESGPSIIPPLREIARVYFGLLLDFHICLFFVFSKGKIDLILSLVFRDSCMNLRFSLHLCIHSWDANKEKLRQLFISYYPIIHPIRRISIATTEKTERKITSHRKTFLYTLYYVLIQPKTSESYPKSYRDFRRILSRRKYQLYISKL